MVMPGKNYQDTAVLKVDPNDLIIVRVGESLTQAAIHELQDAFRNANPDWKGPLLILRPDQQIEKLPEITVRKVYGALRTMYGDDQRTIDKRLHELRQLLKDVHEGSAPYRFQHEEGCAGHCAGCKQRLLSQEIRDRVADALGK